MSKGAGRPTGVQGLNLRPLSDRAHIKAAEPESAIDTRYDLYSPLELYFSDWRTDYLTGQIKVVRNSLPLIHSSIHLSYSLVPVPVSEQKVFAKKHRQGLLDGLALEYLNEVRRNVVKALGLHNKGARRLRYRSNKRMDEAGRRDPDFVDQLFADHPAALAQAGEIREHWETLKEDSTETENVTRGDPRRPS